MAVNRIKILNIMDNSWHILTQILTYDHKEELAGAILEALKSQYWHRIDIEIRDHRMHAINVTRRTNLPKVKNSTHVPNNS